MQGVEQRFKYRFETFPRLAADPMRFSQNHRDCIDVIRDDILVQPWLAISPSVSAHRAAKRAVFDVALCSHMIMANPGPLPAHPVRPQPHWLFHQGCASDTEPIIVVPFTERPTRARAHLSAGRPNAILSPPPETAMAKWGGFSNGERAANRRSKPCGVSTRGKAPTKGSRRACVRATRQF
jgi:hypothetical protein